MTKRPVMSTEQQKAAFNMSAAMQVIGDAVDHLLNGNRRPGEENIKFDYGVVVIMPEESSPGREAVFVGSVDLDHAIAKLRDLQSHAIDINPEGVGHA